MKKWLTLILILTGGMLFSQTQDPKAIYENAWKHVNEKGKLIYLEGYNSFLTEKEFGSYSPSDNELNLSGMLRSEKKIIVGNKEWEIIEWGGERIILRQNGNDLIFRK